MKKTLFILVSAIILLMTGCGDKHQIPEGVIPREEMIDIIVDAWIMESGIHTMIKEYERLDSASVTLYAEFFETHHISKEQFVQSIEYYTNEEKASENFIKECVQRLEERKDEFTAVADPVSQPQ